MLSRQDLVKVRGAEGAKPMCGGSGGPPPENFEQLIAGNDEISKHFRHFLVTLKEWVISRKRRGELDSDPKMNETEHL